MMMTIGIGSTVGAGIFVTSGEAAKNYAGPSIILSFIFSSISCFFSALCYAEFASRVPVSGSAYSYSYVSLGEGVAWFIGWDLFLEYGVAASAIARGWSGYVVAFFEHVQAPLPKWLYSIPLGSDLEGSPITAIIIFICTLIVMSGTKESARMNNIITCWNLVLIFFIIAIGVFCIDTKNYAPFMPFGFAGTLKASGIVFFSYIGFDSVSTLSAEVANPQRDIPRGIVGTLCITTALYVAMSLVLTGMTPSGSINIKAPLSEAFLSAGLGWVSTAVALGSVTTLTACTLCSLFGNPRILYRMSIDGLIPERFSQLSKKNIPQFACVVTGTIASFIGFLLDIDTLSNMISIGTLCAFTVVCLSVLFQRYCTNESADREKSFNLISVYSCASVVLAFLPIFSTTGGLQVFVIIVAIVVVTFMVYISFSLSKASAAQVPGTGFKCPYLPYIPCVGVYLNLCLIASLPASALWRLLVWALLGAAVVSVFPPSISWTFEV